MTANVRTIIAWENPGQMMPDTYLEKLFKHPIKGAGFAIADDGEIEFRTGVNPTLKDFKEYHPQLKDYGVLYAFTITKEMLSEDDVQPFELIVENKQTLLVCAADGVFSDAFSKEASSKSPAFFLAKTYLLPKFNKIYRLGNGGDIEKFMNVLREADVNMELMNTMKGEADILLMPAIGEPLHLSNKKATPAFSWGWCTDACGYAEKEFPDKAETGGGLFGKPLKALKNVLHMPEKKEEKVEVHTVEKPAEDKGPTMTEKNGKSKMPLIAETEPVKQKTAVEVPVDNGKTTVTSTESELMVQCPAEIVGKKNRREWYEKHAGFKPEGYNGRPKVISRLKANAPSTEGSRGSYKAFDEKFMQAATAGKQPTGSAPTASEPKVKPPETKKGEERPVLGGLLREKVKNLMASGNISGLIDQHNALNLEQLREVEAEIPKYTSSTGESLLRTLVYPEKVLIALQNSSPEALRYLSMEWQSKLRDILVKEVQPEAPLDGKKQEPETEQVVSPSASKTAGKKWQMPVAV